MEKITERELLYKILDNLCDEFIHMIYVFAKSLHTEQMKH